MEVSKILRSLSNPLSEPDLVLLYQIYLNQYEPIKWKDIADRLTTDQWLQFASYETDRQRDRIKQERKSWGQADWLAYQLGSTRIQVLRNSDQFLTFDYLYGEEFNHLVNKKPHNLDGSVFLPTLLKRAEEIRKGEEFYFVDQNDAPFSISYLCNIQLGDKKYTSLMQFIMHLKSILFIDRNIEEEVMSISDPKRIFELGSKINNFDKRVWNVRIDEGMLEGNRAKFNQNEHLKEALIKTRGKTIVIACDNENKWGIGCDTSDARAYARETWPGKNFLGELLTNIRIELIGA